MRSLPKGKEMDTIENVTDAVETSINPNLAVMKDAALRGAVAAVVGLAVTATLNLVAAKVQAKMVARQQAKNDGPSDQK